MQLPDVDLLSASEEIALAKAIEVGLAAKHRLSCGAEHKDADLLVQLVDEGSASRERLWLANLRLVAWVSSPLAARHSLPSDDLFQAGCEGLGEAIWRWDYQRGFRFSTYAHHKIRAKVASAVRTRCGQQPESLGRILGRLRRAADGSLNTAPEELAQSAGCGVQVAFEALRFREFVVDPISQPLAPIADRESSTCAELAEWLDQLPAMERQVIALRYGFHHVVYSQQQVGHILHTSSSSVSRMERNALGVLRELAA